MILEAERDLGRADTEGSSLGWLGQARAGDTGSSCSKGTGFTGASSFSFAAPCFARHAGFEPAVMFHKKYIRGGGEIDIPAGSIGRARGSFEPRDGGYGTDRSLRLKNRLLHMSPSLGSLVLPCRKRTENA